ncbi:hypothetical protein D1BOALGB6SA_7500 [Olavius sp. associated proteobacterium Delta 1]|nr:hypothetical protein D1BOALGB6SA_7500 [Olavius sp. associated proteobacterium Delta 1]
MKAINRSAFVGIILLLLVSASFAQVDSLKEMTIVVPAQSIARAIKPLLPYKIDIGKNFIGSFFIKSIDNIKIKKDKILFSSLISGKDIKYATKIGKQTINFVVGEVNLPTDWALSFKYDKTNKRLLVLPSSQGSKDEKDFSQGDALLNTLLTAFGGIEYPVDLSNLKPVKSEFYNQLVTLNVAIADIYAGDDKLFVELIPAVQIDRLNE